jgi:hypothetical protein
MAYYVALKEVDVIVPQLTKRRVQDKLAYNIAHPGAQAGHKAICPSKIIYDTVPKTF